MRAKAGGQTGMNGEHYEGGQFLPNTRLGKMERPKRGSGKQQVGPYDWRIAPEGKRSIFEHIQAFVNWKTGEVMVGACRFYGRDEAEVTDMYRRWQAGELWTD